MSTTARNTIKHQHPGLLYSELRERLPHTESLIMGYLQQNGENMDLNTSEPTEDKPIQSHSRTHTFAGSRDMDNEHSNAEKT